MSIGPGKYDDVATLAREATGAESVVVMVSGGTRGNGFSVQTFDPAFHARLPALLRRMADRIEVEIARGQP